MTALRSLRRRSISPCRSRPASVSRTGAVMAFPYLALAAVLLHRGCGQGNSGGGVSTRCQRAGGVRKTRRHLCVDARGLQRHGKALLERRDRKSVVSGKRVSVRVELGGRRAIKKK